MTIYPEKYSFMTLKMILESRVRTQNELLIKLYKKYENWVPILNAEGGKIAKTFRKVRFLPILTVLDGPKLDKWGRMNAF